MIRRSSAIINEPILLGYRYLVAGVPTDIPEYLYVEIWKGFPGEVGSELLGTVQQADITRKAVGEYELVMSAVSAPGNYYDKHFYRLNPDAQPTIDVIKTEVAETLEAKLDEVAVNDNNGKVGYLFQNYEVPAGEWGEILTYDDLMGMAFFGNTIKSANGQELSKAQVRQIIAWSMNQIENYLGIVIRRRKIVTKPASNLVRSKLWKVGVDYTHEDDAYEFEPRRWENMGYLQLNYFPLISVSRFMLYSYVESRILDVLQWIRIHKKTGQLQAYPKVDGMNQGVFPFIGAEGYYLSSLNRHYPGGFQVDYEAGYENSDWVPEEIRQIVMKVSAITAYIWVGNGIMPGLSSLSIGIDGMSESVTTTQSGSTTFYNATIEQLRKDLETELPRMKSKFSNFPIQFV